jgi:hypothetical protein
MMDSPSPDEEPQAEPTPAERAQILMAEARAAALEHTRIVDAALRGVVARARDIAEGGDVYPAPIRDFCGRLADDTDQRRMLLESLAVRGLDPAAGRTFGLGA